MKVLTCLIAILATAVSHQHLTKELKYANDLVTSKMTREVANIQKDKSFVISAFSLLSPLTLLSEASVGTAQQEILKAIGFPNSSLAKDVIQDINESIQSIKGVELNQANKIYIRDNYELNEDFASTAKDVFNSECQNINFNSPQKAAKEINKWVEDNTNKKIKELVSPNSIDPTTAAILVNALYFKGKWKAQFSKSMTKDRTFFATGNKKINIPTMFRSGDYKYSESKNLDAKIVEIPYEGNETSLVVILPNKIDGINNLIQKYLSGKSLASEFSKEEQKVELSLPKFKIETTINLKDVLPKIGLKKLFDPNQAQLNNLIKGASNLFVSSGTQKTFIEVNEEGTEAAAANELNVQFRSVPQKPRKFNADHPFLFLIKYKHVILFIGVFSPSMM